MQTPLKDSTPKHLRFTDILFAPIGCLIQSSPIVMLVIILIISIVGSYLYYNVNSDLWGFASPDFDRFTVLNNFQTIQSNQNQEWKISYEFSVASRFQGVVRHVTPIREVKFPMLTHDILVTSGDFADPEIVKTRVSNHHFTWSCDCGVKPNGAINLLHTVPANQEIYQQLLDIRSGDQVEISGNEILKIDSLNSEGNSAGWWQDSGCNTLLVQSVKIIESTK